MNAAIALGLIAVVAGAASGQGAHSLCRRPHAGQSAQYDLTYHASSQDGTVALLAELSISITKVDANGSYTERSQVSNTRLQVDGVFVHSEEGAHPKPNEVRFDAQGNRIGPAENADEDADDPVGRAISVATDFHPPAAPVKAGYSWSRKIPGSDTRRPMEIDYRVDSFADGAARVHFETKETVSDAPVSASGWINISLGDGSLLSFSATIQDVRFAEGVAPGTATLQIERKPK